MKSNRVAGVAIAVFAVFLCASPAFGIGVLAVNGDTGGWGMAWDYGDLAEARKAALEECGEGCEIVSDFENSCAAYVSSHTEDGFVVVWGGGDNELDAKTVALEECLADTTGRCVVEIAVCDSGDSERSISNADEEEAAPGSPVPVRVFRDCPDCPEMVVIPAGTFRMGCVSGLDCDDDELPVHTVTISHPFALSKYEITFEQWSACVADGMCREKRGEWARIPLGMNHPVNNMYWIWAKEFVDWLSQLTGEEYRLPSESEWEYAARAGTKTKYSWGNEIGENRANCAEERVYDPEEWNYRRIPGTGCNDAYETLAPVGSFEANAFGLHDMHGNAVEVLEDCWNESYVGAPKDGSPWLQGDCEYRVIRGGGVRSPPASLRSANRNATNNIHYAYGLRVARTLKP